MIPYGGEGLRGEPQDFRIPRTGDRDLAFRGWLLSHAEERGGSPGLTRGVDIDIYLTIRLRLVAHLCRWSLREGEGLRDERSEEHTAELQSRLHLVCRLLLEKKKNKSMVV